MRGGGEGSHARLREARWCLTYAIAVAEGARVISKIGALLVECGIVVEGRRPIEAIADALHQAHAMTMVLEIMVGRLDKLEGSHVLLGEMPGRSSG